MHQYDRLPSYYVFAGLLFSPLTQPLLHEWGDDWYNQSPRRLCERALNDDQEERGEEVVVLSQAGSSMSVHFVHSLASIRSFVRSFVRFVTFA